MVTVDFEKMELESVAYALNTGKPMKRTKRNTLTGDLLIGSGQEENVPRKRKSRLDKELSGTELFGGAITKD